MREITPRQLRLNQSKEIANAPFKLVSRGRVLGYFVTQLPNVTQSDPVDVHPLAAREDRPVRDLSKGAQASGKMASNALA